MRGNSWLSLLINIIIHKVSIELKGSYVHECPVEQPRILVMVVEYTWSCTIYLGC